VRRFFVLVLLTATLGLVCMVFWPDRTPTAVPTQTAEKSPRLLIHLLDYLAADYGGAVQKGSVISTFEYEEQLEFAQTAVDLSRTLPEIQTSSEIPALVSELSDLIHSKADPAEVADVARRTQAKVIGLVGLPVAPADWPSLASGEALFQNACTQCHGREGRGDGPSAANLAVKPLNFQDPTKMREISAFQVFNTIRLGVQNTPMPAFANYSDRDTWNLAFYVHSLRFRDLSSDPGIAAGFEKIKSSLKLSPDDLLKVAASDSDTKIEARLGGTPDQIAISVAGLRLHAPEESPQTHLDSARSQLEEARSNYQAGHFEIASKSAVSAYIDGVEPVEARLRADNPQVVQDLEQSMGLVRTAIRDRKPLADVGQAVARAQAALARAADQLNERKSSPALTFTLSFGILLREGFEAALIIVALLGVIRVSGAKKANRWVHAGWLSAVGLGVIAWIFSGWLTNWSGLRREVMEGITGALTVAILLYVGFWLHSRTEITRWKTFVDARIKSAVEQRNLLQLAFISFLAAFREAIETVLFLRGIWLEGGSNTKTALAGGVAAAFILTLVLGWLLLTFSARIPIKTLFNMSSLVMVTLAVILSGKALHSFQEVDLVSFTLSPLNLNWDWLGLYPTWEPQIAQFLVLVLSLFLWMFGKRSVAQEWTPARPAR
jgi:high-affinity iron transporter